MSSRMAYQWKLGDACKAFRYVRRRWDLLLLVTLLVSLNACQTAAHEISEQSMSQVSLDRPAEISQAPEPQNDFNQILTESGQSIPEPQIVSEINIRPDIPIEWSSPLVISPLFGATSIALVDLDSPIYVSWSISILGNMGGDHFFVDLYLDGVVVERWNTSEFNTRGTYTVRDWDSLKDRKLLKPGKHTLAIVVDSTNLVNENNELDNRYYVEFEVQQTGSTDQTLSQISDRLPNLVPFVPKEWETAVQIATSRGVSSDIWVHEGESLQIAFKNNGISSVNEFFFIYLYLDDLLVARFAERDLLANEAVVISEWTRLKEMVIPSPGMHTLKLVVDPTDLIAEVNENDNSFSKEFYWNPDVPLDHPEESLPELKSPPNLITFTPPGWDGPVVVTSQINSLESDEDLRIGSNVYIHWAITNTGSLDFEGNYTVEIRLGGNAVGTWNRSRLRSGMVDFHLGWNLNRNFHPRSEAKTKLQILLYRGDPGYFSPPEIIAEKEISWSNEIFKPDSSPVEYSKEELREKVMSLDLILNSLEPPVGSMGNAYLASLMEITEATYYMLHGKSLFDENLSIHILTEEEYQNWIEIECTDSLSQLSIALQLEYRKDCNRLTEFTGYFTHWRNRNLIVIRGQNPSIQVLSALAHELGHFRNFIDTAGRTANQESIETLALHEAQAFVYQILFFRTLENLSGRDLLLYPNLDGYSKLISSQIDLLADSADSSEHAKGRLLVWLALLTNEQLRQERSQFLNERYLNASSASTLFDHLTDIGTGNSGAYVTETMRGLNTQIVAILDLVDARLISGLPYWNEGSPYLRDIGLFLP